MNTQRVAAEGGWGVGGRSGSATHRVVSALPPNPCSLSKPGPVTASLPGKSLPDFNIYLSQVAELAGVPPGINAAINL